MKILLLGAYGRLGQKIAQNLVKKNIDFSIIERDHTNTIDLFFNFINKYIDTKNENIVILDVSLPKTTEKIANFLLDFSKPQSVKLMIGTTGHTKNCLHILNQLSCLLPVCVVPNFSKGIFLLSEILRLKIFDQVNLIPFIESLGFKTQLTDIHHKYKKDAPSGTAKLLNQSLKLPNESIVSIREDEHIGQHIVSFITENETLTLTHTVTDRDVFAEGAYELAKRFFEKNFKPGMYAASDLYYR